MPSQVGAQQDAGNRGRTVTCQPLKRRLITTAFDTMNALGAFSLAGRMSRRRQSLLILCYHGISLVDEHEWNPLLYISVERFRQRLAVLRAGAANVLPLGEALHRLKDGSLPPLSVAITFDDGFYDFSKHAVPLLKEFGFPSTLYLTTYYVKYPLPVYNLMLDYVLWKSGQPSLVFPDLGIAAPLAIRGEEARRRAVGLIRDNMENHGLDTVAKDQAVGAIADQVKVDYAALKQSRILQLMRPAEVKEVSASGIDLQLHTHRHRTPEDRSLVFKEIDENRALIREFSGKDPVHFCYPSGRYTPELMQWLREYGVASATTCKHALANRASDPMELPRLLDDSVLDQSRFSGALNGFIV